MARTVSRPPRPALHPPPSDAATRGMLVATPTELGKVVRWARGQRQVTLEDAAARSGVSPGLLRELELATGAVGLGRALYVLATFGLDVIIVPRDPNLTLRDPSDLPRSHSSDA